MNNEEHFQEVKEKEILRLTTPISYPKLGSFTFGIGARDCEGNPVPKVYTFSGNKYILEPKPGILSDDEILMYAGQSIEASRIRLKRGIGTHSDKLLVNNRLIYLYIISFALLFITGMMALISKNILIILLFLLIMIFCVGSYVYYMHIKNYTLPKYTTESAESKSVNENKISPTDDLFLLFESKEKIAREMVEKKFPAPQLTNTKFNSVLDNCRDVVESQIEILNALTPTDKTKYEIDSRKKLIKELISKIDDLTNELILSEESNIEEVIEDMDKLIDSVKDYE